MLQMAKNLLTSVGRFHSWSRGSHSGPPASVWAGLRWPLSTGYLSRSRAAQPLSRFRGEAGGHLLS